MKKFLITSLTFLFILIPVTYIPKAEEPKQEVKPIILVGDQNKINTNGIVWWYAAYKTISTTWIYATSYAALQRAMPLTNKAVYQCSQNVRCTSKPYPPENRLWKRM